MVEETGKRFDVPHQPVAESEIKETFTTDVVVVGAGTSGKAAALSAAQAGARVMQIDKHTTYRWGGGMIGAIDSRIQRKLGVKINKDEVCLQLMKWGGNKPDQRLYRVWADNSGPILDWLMEITEPEDIKTLPMQWPRPAGWDDKSEYYPDYPTAHCHSDGKSFGLNHSLALNIVQKRALDLGVEIRYQTPAVQLIRQPNGRVSGVIARDKEGNYLKFNARKAVILCTGDYGNNPWMVQQYCPEAAEVARTRNIYMTRNQDLVDAPEPLNVGDGQQMAMLVGAIMEEGFGAPMSHATVPAAGANAFLRVNTLGERY
jgi:fumarate reductase flavoprotein subunit